MKNPYLVLKVNQNATKVEINNAVKKLMIDNDLKELNEAKSYLFDPSKRLAADFLYPVRLTDKRPKVFTYDKSIEKSSTFSIKDIDPGYFDSLTCKIEL